MCIIDPLRVYHRSPMWMYCILDTPVHASILWDSSHLPPKAITTQRITWMFKWLDASGFICRRRWGYLWHRPLACIRPLKHDCPPPCIHDRPPPTINKEPRDTSSVFSEFWHDWGEQRLISSGDSMAYEYAIRGCHVFALMWLLRRSFTEDISTVNLMALREATED